MGLLATFARSWLTRSIKPFRFTDQNDSFLDYADLKKLGLYVHIPFCRTICEFCPYCKTLYDQKLANRYIDALLEEIKEVGFMSADHQVTATSLYFGGGSPALVVDRIPEVIAQLRRYFDITEGIGVELHPQDVNVDTLRRLKQAGVTKISVGIQSFQNEYLSILGRQEMDHDKIFKALSQVSFETVSMDFIFALPGQTIDLLKKDIELAFGFGANHVAIYPFVDFSFTDRQFSKMMEKQKKELLFKLVEYCEENGYTRDSIWTFSKDGSAQYSSMTRENFLGFGCSATTLLKDQFKVNTFDVGAYIERVEKSKLPTALTIKFSLRQRMVYYLFWTVYAMHIDSVAFREFFGYSLNKCYRLELWLSRLLGLARKDGDIYTMTTKGSYYYHYYEHYYTLSYIDQMWNLMRNTAFPDKLIIR